MAAVLGMAICAMPVQAFDKYSINREDLPETAQQFLTDHFGKARVSMVKTDKHLLKKTDYDVKLQQQRRVDLCRLQAEGGARFADSIESGKIRGCQLPRDLRDED